MSDFVFAPSDVPSLPISGQRKRFPIRRIFCVGRNYAAHAAEMGYEVDREKPFYFSKSAFHAVESGTMAAYPPGTENYHFEMEFAVAIGGVAFQLAPEQALDAVFGYAAALDMTRRDLQLSERKKQRPWDLGKDVEASAVFGAITPAANFTIGAQGIWLKQNGREVQRSTLDLMVWSVPEIIAHLSGFYTLEPGDIILTGTPEGVGPVAPGDHLEGGVDGLAPLGFAIGEPQVASP